MRATLERVAGRAVPRETFERLEAYVALLREENARQNLVASSTIDQVWDRHVLDSAQLVRYEEHPGASWIDIGTGAGLPGVVIGCLVKGPVTLLEPRRLRAEFLHRVVEVLHLNAKVVTGKAERLEGKFDTVTARAVASLTKLLEISHHLSTRNSRWVLPKGRNWESELADAKREWQGVFHVEQSLTDGNSHIVVATGVEARRKS